MAPAMIDLLRGMPVPDTLYTPREAVNRDNIRLLYPDTEAC
jgi:hypothetical protein